MKAVKFSPEVRSLVDAPASGVRTIVGIGTLLAPPLGSAPIDDAAAAYLRAPVWVESRAVAF